MIAEIFENFKLLNSQTDKVLSLKTYEQGMIQNLDNNKNITASSRFISLTGTYHCCKSISIANLKPFTLNQFQIPYTNQGKYLL
jgi:hypothetical protein